MSVKYPPKPIAKSKKVPVNDVLPIVEPPWERSKKYPFMPKTGRYEMRATITPEINAEASRLEIKLKSLRTNSDIRHASNPRTIRKTIPTDEKKVPKNEV